MAAARYPVAGVPALRDPGHDPDDHHGHRQRRANPAAAERVPAVDVRREEQRGSVRPVGLPAAGQSGANQLHHRLQQLAPVPGVRLTRPPWPSKATGVLLSFRAWGEVGPGATNPESGRDLATAGGCATLRALGPRSSQAGDRAEMGKSLTERHRANPGPRSPLAGLPRAGEGPGRSEQPGAGCPGICRRSLGHHPGSLGGWFQLGRAALRLGRRSEAIECFEEGDRSRPRQGPTPTSEWPRQSWRWGRPGQQSASSRRRHP